MHLSSTGHLHGGWGQGQEDTQWEFARQHHRPKVLAPFLLKPMSSVAGITVPRILSSSVTTAVSPDDSRKLEMCEGELMNVGPVVPRNSQNLE